MIEYEWDARRAEINFAKHGIPFEAIRRFNWESAVERVDDRDDYGEFRMAAIGFIGLNLYVLIYTRRDEAVRVISLRKTTKSEQRDYDHVQTR